MILSLKTISEKVSQPRADLTSNDFLLKSNIYKHLQTRKYHEQHFSAAERHHTPAALPESRNYILNSRHQISAKSKTPYDAELLKWHYVSVDINCQLHMSLQTEHHQSCISGVCVLCLYLGGFLQNQNQETLIDPREICWFRDTETQTI